jgi:integrase
MFYNSAYQWIAEQMGHTNSNMIRQHYGTRINEDGPDVVGMLQLALKLSPATAPH